MTSDFSFLTNPLYTQFPTAWNDGFDAGMSWGEKTHPQVLKIAALYAEESAHAFWIGFYRGLEHNTERTHSCA